MAEPIWLQYCFNCMAPLDRPDGVCGKCKWDNRNRVNGETRLEQQVLGGQYILGRALGAGGFGVTYVGLDIGLERRVAIKEYFPANIAYRESDGASVRPKTGCSEGFYHHMESALEEGRTVAKMDHIPNVVQIYSVLKANHTIYIVMEYIDGLSLAALIDQKGRLPWDTSLDMLLPVMKALENVHARGVIHRDIKPNNLMWKRDRDEVVLLDFGAARSVCSDGMSVVVTDGYAPVEQYSRQSKQDGRVDEFALCATMYHMITGRRPLSVTARMANVAALEPPSRMGIDMPSAVEAVMMKGLSLMADDRYPTMAALRHAFEAARRDTGEETRWEGEADRQADARRKAEAERQAEARRQAEAARQAEARRKAEAERQAEARRQAEAARQAEARRKAEAERRVAKARTKRNPGFLLIVLFVILAAGARFLWNEHRLTEAMAAASTHISETVSDGWNHTVGLKRNGTVVAVGYNGFHQCDVNGWSNIVAVAAGTNHTVGLKGDGTVVAVGDNEYHQCDVSGWSDIVAVSAGDAHTVGLRRDGTVVAVGFGGSNRSNVSGWSDIVAVAAGGWCTVGLKRDGTVVAVGANNKHQCDVNGWSDIVAVSAGTWHTVGLKRDGTVVAVGSNDQHQCDVSGWSDIVAVSAGLFHTVGLKRDGTVVAVGRESEGMSDVSGWSNIMLPASAK